MAKKKTRYEILEEMIKQVDNNQFELLQPAIEILADLEERLSELRKLPFISVNPKNKNQQRTNPAGKQYKEFLQSYCNVMKIIQRAVQNIDSEESDGLQEFLDQWKIPQ